VSERIVLAPMELADAIEPAMLDAVVSNPPYIPTPVYEELPIHIRDHEPRAALDGGPTGLSVIQAVVQDAGIALRPGGFLFLETGEDQAEAAGGMLRDCGFEQVGVGKDLAGRERVVTGRMGAD
jgi:release factor glutamine methyltransferase